MNTASSPFIFTVHFAIGALLAAALSPRLISEGRRSLSESSPPLVSITIPPLRTSCTLGFPLPLHLPRRARLLEVSAFRPKLSVLPHPIGYRHFSHPHPPDWDLRSPTDDEITPTSTVFQACCQEKERMFDHPTSARTAL